jgi:hypothetical protein
VASLLCQILAVITQENVCPSLKNQMLILGPILGPKLGSISPLQVEKDFLVWAVTFAIHVYMFVL